ncbi:hypothetical protein TELCIR_25127, partial [Teladorsagia circumcincta]
LFDLITFSSGNVPPNDLFFTETGETLLRTLCNSLLHDKNDIASTSTPGKNKLAASDANRSKRKKKKFRNRSIYGYLSDGADGCQSDSVYVRPLSDVLSQSPSSAICSAVE